MLELDKLCYRHPQALTETPPWSFSLRAKAATVTSISGVSGGGKSTLLELIAGLLQPTSGALSWNDQDLLPLTAGARPISLLFQQHNLFEHLSAVDNVLLGHKGKVDSTTRQAAERALADMGLAAHTQARADRLSGGQQQRVALARTLLRRSKVVLLDEPFSALDDHTRRNAWPLVRALADEHGCCVLMVTHDQRDCDAVADRQLLLSEGQLAVRA